MKKKSIVGLMQVIALSSVKLLASCDKEEIMHHEQAGAWMINSITTTYYTGGVEDSTSSMTSAGIFKLWDNHSENDNIAEYEFFQSAPASIYDVADPAAGLDPQGGTCWWHAGPGSNDRLTLWYDTPGVDKYVIYTVTELKYGKMTLTYVRVDSQGHMSVKEIWELESY